MIDTKIIPIRKKAAPSLFAGKLLIRLRDKIIFIEFDDILYCKSDGNYTIVLQSMGRKELSVNA